MAHLSCSLVDRLVGQVGIVVADCVFRASTNDWLRIQRCELKPVSDRRFRVLISEEPRKRKLLYKIYARAQFERISPLDADPCLDIYTEMVCANNAATCNQRDMQS